MWRLAFVLMGFFYCGAVSSEPLPRHFGYVLQADELAGSRAGAITKLAGRDWLILDTAFTAGEDWQPTDLAALHARGQTVLAYFSIGEAENYRGYWQASWLRQRPTWLLTQNPDWAGNYRVRYWQTAWQKLILARLDEILRAGFDGMYLDIVDGYEFFENGQAGRRNPETGRSYREDMIAWVTLLADYARKHSPNFRVVPQNGAALLADSRYRATIDATGIEDLFTDGNKNQPAAQITETLKLLALLNPKPVLLTEYPTQTKLQQQVRQRASQAGLIWLVTDRDLKTLGQSGTTP